jgi:hypothetical protein
MKRAWPEGRWAVGVSGGRCGMLKPGWEGLWSMTVGSVSGDGRVVGVSGDRCGMLAAG